KQSKFRPDFSFGCDALRWLRKIAKKGLPYQSLVNEILAGEMNLHRIGRTQKLTARHEMAHLTSIRNQWWLSPTIYPDSFLLTGSGSRGQWCRNVMISTRLDRH